MTTGKKIGLIAVLILVLGAAVFGFQVYKTYFMPNVSGQEKWLYVRTGAPYEALLKELEEKGSLNSLETFESAATKMSLEKYLKPGRYRLKSGMGNRELINSLKAGNQEAVQLKFQNIRKKENFAAFLAKNLEPDSLKFIAVIDSLPLVSKYGFDERNVYSMFIPNTYQMYWNISAVEFFERMQKEYEKFWNEDRLKKAERLKMTPIEVSILASIVDAEALFDKEMPTIAGLYINRLNKGIRLQADPTVIFANDDFTVKRVTNKLLGVESPYNTYRYAGLPPGPIMMPSINAIDAVLNKEDNNYIYMCAKEDFSGYHNFAVTVTEHEANARKYREALNKKNIFR